MECSSDCRMTLSLRNRIARPAGSLIVMSTILLAPGPAAALTGVELRPVFATDDQSIFGPGQGLNIQGDLFVGLEWSQQNFEADLPGITASGFGAFQLDAGRIGFEAFADISSGVVDVEIPQSVFFNHPQQVAKGQVFTLNSFRTLIAQPLPGQPIGDGKMEINGTGFEAGVDFVIEGGAGLGGGIDLVGTNAIYSSTVPGAPTGFNVQPLSDPNLAAIAPQYGDDFTILDVDFSERLVDLTLQGNVPSVDFAIPGGFAGITAQVPDPLDLSTDMVELDGALRAAGKTDPFVEASLDAIALADLLANLTPVGAAIPPVSGSIGVDIWDDIEASVSYELISSALTAGAALAQDFEFNVRDIQVRLETNTGQVVTGLIGDDFDLLAPADGSDLEVAVFLDLVNEFRSRTGLSPELAATLDLLAGKLTVAGFDLFNFGPLFSFPVSTSFDPFWLLDDTFALGGFNQEIAAFVIPVGETTIIPEPATWLAGLGLALAVSRRRPRSA